MFALYINLSNLAIAITLHNHNNQKAPEAAKSFAAQSLQFDYYFLATNISATVFDIPVKSTVINLLI